MLRQLDNQSLLMLYLADELSVDERVEFERMLAADANLRAELDDLRHASKLFESGMTRLDTRPVTAESIMVRRIGSAMRQRLADRMVTAGPQMKISAPARKWHYPSWGYAAAAAVVLITSIGYWGLHLSGRAKHPGDQRIVQVPVLPGTPLTVQPAPAVPDSVASADADDEVEPHADLKWYRGTQHQLAELTRSQNIGDAAIFGLNDSNE